MSEDERVFAETCEQWRQVARFAGADDSTEVVWADPKARTLAETTPPERTADVELTEFLSARLAEDEAVAREIAAEMVRVADQYIPGAAPDPADGGMYASEDGRNTPAVIVGPARVLADVAAKRRIVALHTYPALACYWSHDSMWRHEPGEACDTLRALAQPYRDHPDYDPAWAD